MTMKVPCPIARQARENRGRDAVAGEKVTYSYEDLDKMASRLETGLRHKGVEKATRVGILARNSVETIALMAALWRMGAVAIPVNHRFPAAAIKKITARLKIFFFAVDQPSASLLDGIFDENIKVVRLDEELNRDRGETKRENDVFIDLNGDATIILTSGSTGEEKAVLHTLGNHYYNALGSNENIVLGPGDRWLLSLPLFHVGGLGILFRCFLAGAAVVAPDNCQLIDRAVSRFPVTHISLVSTQLHRLLRSLKYHELKNSGTWGGSVPGLKAVLLGGSGFSSSLVREAVEAGMPVFTTYGLSEMASQVTTTPPGSGLDRLATSGKLLTYRELRIGANSEICVRGAVRFKGYVEEHGTVSPFDPDGWFRTGDLGRIDQIGGEEFLSVWGRVDNMFISGGENIMPEEIERLLVQIPGIRQAVVVPMENKEYGHRPAAFIEMDGLWKIKGEEVLRHLETHLPRFKVPDVFYAWPGEADEQEFKLKRSFFRHLLMVPGLEPLFRKRL